MKQVEAEVTAECRNWLVKRGWRPHRNHCGVFFTERGARITGEPPGTPDWSFTRPTDRGHGNILYVEMKATAGKPSPKQREMRALLQHYGYAVLIAHSLDELKREYEALYGVE